MPKVTYQLCNDDALCNYLARNPEILLQMHHFVLLLRNQAVGGSSIFKSCLQLGAKYMTGENSTIPAPHRLECPPWYCEY